jgi:hypothetical protein
MLAAMKEGAHSTARRGDTRIQRIFYAIFLPVGAAANLALGLIVLTGLKSEGDFGWLELGTGAFCCTVAGWLAASSWTRFYWKRSMAVQVARWRRIADAFFVWLEDAPVPPETVSSLKSSLEEVVAAS